MTAPSDRFRALLLDIPLGLLIGAISLAFARAAGQFAAVPTDNDRRWPRWGPPGGDGGDFGPPDFGPATGGPGLGEPYTGAALIWAGLLVLGIAIRRLRPRTGFAITVIAATGYLGVGLPIGPVVIGPAVALVAMANRMSPRRWAPWATLLAPLIWAGFVSQPDLGLLDPSLYTTLILLGAAMIIPALIATLRRSRIDAGRRTRELDLRRAAYQERLRIARDVHDLIGHSLSVINMQAGVALYVLDKGRGSDATDTGREKVEESLQAIRSTSKNALDELRATLAVFRGETGELRAPVGGLARLPELVDAFAAAGRTVKLIMAEPVDGLPGPIDSAAYRIVQEALTNVARHTQHATATVTIERRPTTLTIDVTDDGPPARIPADHDGNGLLGMVERAESVGGTVRAGPDPGGGFAVHAEFGLQPPRSTP
ncbi:sensor histidine kinase [Microlunatus soli]|uniref:histidine kinase n=1 Tax=Microlunatus soli TaxID=630515 RepID=A0A1H1VE90_9ACTN|nr:sensor histidine kinase [Microlunatus soli]SDS83094.1 Signal transduction histidine kinase [Microlunatus soli]